jgi:arylformamidase
VLIDITKTINKNTFIYPNDPKTKICEFYNFKNDNFRLTKLEIGLHTSTHIDFPSHFIENGKTSSEFNDINYFIGKVLIVDLYDFPKVLNLEIDSIFIKTQNPKDIFLEKYDSINKEQLNFLIKNKIKFIGTDFYTIEPYNSKNFYFHKDLLRNNVLIIENLNLSNVKNGVYNYYIFPMKIEDVEASICRIAVYNN